MPSLDRLASWGLLPHSPRSAELSRQIGGTVCCCDPMDRLSRRLYADIGEEYCKVENHAEELLPFLSRYRTQPFLVRLFWLLFLCRVFRCQDCHTAQIVFLPLYWLN